VGAGDQSLPPSAEGSGDIAARGVRGLRQSGAACSNGKKAGKIRHNSMLEIRVPAGW
jgi:hypothetical protein